MLCWSSSEEMTHTQGKINPSKMIGAERVHQRTDIVQETARNTIPRKKKWKKPKWLSEDALQIAVKRRVKSKGENERYSI